MEAIHENLDDEAKEKLYEAAKKRMKTICQNLDEEAKEKIKVAA